MNLDDILKQPDASIDAIGLNLDIVPFKDKYAVFLKILSKVTKTGSITITGMDLHAFSKAVLYGDKSLEEANQILEHVRSMDSLDNVKRFLLQNNFKTESCKRENGNYVCTARYQV